MLQGKYRKFEQKVVEKYQNEGILQISHGANYFGKLYKLLSCRNYSFLLQSIDITIDKRHKSATGIFTIYINLTHALFS